MTGEAGRSYDERFAEFAERLEINKQYYSENDPANRTLSVFAEAVLKTLDESHFRSQLEMLFEFRPEVDAKTAIKLLERVYQADLLQHDPNYPRGYQTIDTWLSAFDDIEADMVRDGIVTHNLLHRNLQSNIAERYKTIKLLASALQDRFDEPPSHLDVGSSVLHGDIKLAFNRAEDPVRVPFQPIEVASHMDRMEITDPYLTQLANTALSQHVEFGQMTGIDITDVNDPVVKQWAKSCSFYPDELLNDRVVAEYDELERLDPHHERVQAIRGDFARLDAKKFRELAPVDGYDIITFSTIFYQVDHRDRTAMLVNASQLLSDRGIIVIQDGIGGDFSKRYNYATTVIDGTARHPSEEMIMRWETPRCQKAALGMGKLSLGGKLYSLEHLLEKRFG